MPGYTITPDRMRRPARHSSQGLQIRRSNGIRRNTAAFNPNDAIELSKVSMTNARAAASRRANFRAQIGDRAMSTRRFGDAASAPIANARGRP
jgi:hypothetical protein